MSTPSAFSRALFARFRVTEFDNTLDEITADVTQRLFGSDVARVLMETARSKTRETAELMPLVIGGAAIEDIAKLYQGVVDACSDRDPLLVVSELVVKGSTGARPLNAAIATWILTDKCEVHPLRALLLIAVTIESGSRDVHNAMQIAGESVYDALQYTEVSHHRDDPHANMVIEYE